MKTNKVEYFARCKGIARMGPCELLSAQGSLFSWHKDHKSDVEAWAALKHVDTRNPAEGATVWPEKKANYATK